MSITYDAPTLNADITSALVENQALQNNETVLNSINALLGLNDPEATTNFGNAYLVGGEVFIEQQSGVEIQALAIESDEGQVITITDDILGAAANTVKYYSFDGVGADGDVEFIATVGDPVILSGGGNDLFNLSQSDAEITILAGGGDDDVLTGSADDYISGDDGFDFIIAGAGDDSIYSGTTGEDADFDTIDGGSGWDTVYLPGYASDLDPAQIIDEWVSFDNHTTGDWGALVENVEFINLWEEGSIDNFDPATHTVTGDGLQNSIVVVDNESDLLVARMYQATLNRSADSDGVQYWLGQDATQSLSDIAEQFITSTEFTDDWGNDLTTAEFINQMYVNAFHREADLEGSIFWWQAIESGELTRAEFVVAVVGSDEADTTITNVVQVANII